MKSGLETPMHVHFFGERRVVFSPPLWYDILVLACIFGGFGFAMYAFFTGGYQIGNMPFLGFFLGIAVGLAGIWGALSNERMACDYRNRTYSRLEGQGIGKRLTRGTLDDLDAVVATSEKYLLGLGNTVIYRLIVHWKGAQQPLLIVETVRVTLPPGAPINAYAGNLLAHGNRLAHALGIPFYDNTYYPSPSPIGI